MTAVTVKRWQSRYRLARPEQAERVPCWNAALMDAELHAGGDDEQIVCVRRLHLALRLREDDGASQAREAWSRGLERELARALREASTENVVRYRDRRDAVADMLYRACAGDLRRAWAWRRLGLLPAHRAAAADPPPALAIECAVRELVRERESIWPLLARMLLAEPATGAWSALMGALEEPHWDELLEASPRTQPVYRLARAELPVAMDARYRAEGNAFERALVAWIASHPSRAGLRDRVIATLLLASDGAPRESHAAQRFCAALAYVRHLARSSESGAAGRSARRVRNDAAKGAPAMAPATPNARGETNERSATPAQPAVPRDGTAAREEPPAPELPSVTDALATGWAGLLFLLNVLPARLAEVAGDALRPVLWRLAVVHLGVPAADPAVRAFCGDWIAPEVVELDARALALAAQAHEAIVLALEERLRPAMDAEADLVEFACRRAGELRFEGGWIELAMPAATADARVRRAALDLDPGWLAWLGCVVRFRYE